MCPYCGADCPRLGTTCRARGAHIRDESFVFDSTRLHEWVERLMTERIDHDDVVSQIIADAAWEHAEDPKVIRGEVIESWTERDRPTKGEIER